MLLHGIASLLAFSVAGAGFAGAAAALVRWLGADNTSNAPLLAYGALFTPMALLVPANAWPVAALFATLLLAIAWLDQQAGVVHVGLTAPLALLGLGFAASHDTLSMAAAGLIMGYGLCVVVEFSYRCFRGRDGLGRGDAWVLGAVGAWVGPEGLGPLLALAATTSLAAVLLRDRRLDSAASLPFAPALAAAAWVVWTTCGGPAVIART